MYDSLPKGWVKATLGEVCLPIATIYPEDTPDDEFTYFDIGGIDNVNNRIAETKTFTGRNAPSRARQVVQKEDILFSTVRTYLRKIARIEKDYPNPVASTGFTVIRAADGVSPQFLFFQVLSEGFLQPLHKLQSGTSYPAVRNQDVFSQPILIPPTREQERIADKLDAVFSRLERAESASRRAQERLQRYRAEVLHAAVTGNLTNDWRKAQGKDKKTCPETGEILLQRVLKSRRKEWKGKGEYKEPVLPVTSFLPPPPKTWTTCSLDQLVSSNRLICYGILMPKEHIPDGIPYVKVRDMKGDKIDFVSLPRTSPEIAAKYSRASLKPGDILLAIRGTYGRVAEVPPDLDGGYITQDTARLAITHLVDRRYIALFLRSEHAQNYFDHVAKGVAVKGVNIADVRRCPILLPPLAEQKQIVEKAERRLSAVDRLAAALEQQLTRARATRQSLLQEAFTGRLVPQDPKDESAPVLLKRILFEKAQRKVEIKKARNKLRQARSTRRITMRKQAPSPDSLAAAWKRIGGQTNARLLFNEAGFGSDNVELFYETLRATPEVRTAFQEASLRDLRNQKPIKPSKKKDIEPKGHFRLLELWLEDFKNLKNYTFRFDPAHGLDVILGWNGTGKSNLFEALVIIFRDLHAWSEKNIWPNKPMRGYRLSYLIDDHTVEVKWRPGRMKRPELKMGPIAEKGKDDIKLKPIKRNQLEIPRFIFGYYSGPTNRLAEYFMPMKQAHYVRLREAKADDAKTLTELLEQRRFFCAETHHAKYVLLAFSYKEDPKMSKFLEERLRILGFESALFIIRKPQWAKSGSKAENFWAARGIMRRVMERLRRFSIAPMVVEQSISDGYRTTTEDHYYFFLPDLESLHSFAAEYLDARSFFLALESTDFSELIYDVKIQVRVKSSNTEQVAITFHQLSEGEQQLLMVLGLMRFTKSYQSLVLLDEPDTHLNPHWSMKYLKDLTSVMSDNASESPEQQSSQILMATHDPLVISSLVKEQIRLLKRDEESLVCYCMQPSEDPRGLGFTGILTSDIFDFNSDLDPETMDLLHKQADLAGKENLSTTEARKLEKITEKIDVLGFKTANSDPYYRAFLKALVRRQGIRKLLLKTTPSDLDIDAMKRETDEILKEIEREGESK